MKITLLSIGKNSDKDIEKLIERYVKRLTHYVKFENRSLPDAKVSKTDSRERQKQLEGALLLNALSPADYVVLLDERGKEISSVEYAEMLHGHSLRSTRNLVFVIGGPFGFCKEVYDRGDAMMSMSRMTMTHEMIRLFFIEQTYRAFTIIRGESYHHE